MSDIDTLRDRVQTISDEVAAALKAEPSDASLAGWGQFLGDTTTEVQIGPYGTAAGVAVMQVPDRDTAIDQRIVAQLCAFWEEKPENKLFLQNVRLAFVVLALAKASDPCLAKLRGEIASELLKRQLSDGSWNDALSHSGAAAGGRPDPTSWAVLALVRTGGFDGPVERGASWLTNRVQGMDSTELLSPLGVAAALAGHPNAASVPKLRERGFQILNDNRINKEEFISFFDYQFGGKRQRDYLCFPAFYPISVIINSLSHDPGIFGVVRLDAYRSDAIVALTDITADRTYKLLNARFSSTVDQAFVALSFEQLYYADQTKRSSARLFVPIYKKAKVSLWLNFVAPLLVVALAIVTVADPTTVPLFVQTIAGVRADYLISAATDYSHFLRLTAAVLLAVLPNVPLRAITLVRERFIRR